MILPLILVFLCLEADLVREVPAASWFPLISFLQAGVHIGLVPFVSEKEACWHVGSSVGAA